MLVCKNLFFKCVYFFLLLLLCMFLFMYVRLSMRGFFCVFFCCVFYFCIFQCTLLSSSDLLFLFACLWCTCMVIIVNKIEVWWSYLSSTYLSFHIINIQWMYLLSLSEHKLSSITYQTLLTVCFLY